MLYTSISAVLADMCAHSPVLDTTKLLWRIANRNAVRFTHPRQSYTLSFEAGCRYYQCMVGRAGLPFSFSSSSVFVRLICRRFDLSQSYTVRGERLDVALAYKDDEEHMRGSLQAGSEQGREGVSRAE